MPSEPRSFLFIHGLWITAASWDPWVERLRVAGHEALAPTWPAVEGPAAELRANPGRMAELTVGEVVDHFAASAATMSRPPVLVGHSFGAAVVQLLLDRGIGVAGVALHSAIVRGVNRLTWSSVRTLLPILRNPANRNRTVSFTAEEFHAGAANAMSLAEATAAWEAYAVPAPGRFVFDMAMANLTPHSPLRVDLKKPDRAPLLFVAGGADLLAPPALNRANARKQAKAGAVTAYHEFQGRSHYVSQPGWEDVADLVVAWSAKPTAYGV